MYCCFICNKVLSSYVTKKVFEIMSLFFLILFHFTYKSILYVYCVSSSKYWPLGIYPRIKKYSVNFRVISDTISKVCWRNYT